MKTIDVTEKIRITYVGFHIDTLLLLLEENSFEVMAVSLIEDFISDCSLNPANLLFSLIYSLRRQNKYRLLETFLLHIWAIADKFSTSIYFRYRNYLKAISMNKIAILDFNNKAALVDYLKSTNVALLVVNTWEMLPKEIIFAPKHGAINIHPSKLPQYQGALPTLWSLKNNDKESAVTYLLMDQSMDSGNIISQHTFSISEADDWYSVELKITGIIKKTFIPDLKGYLTGKIRPTVQDVCTRSTTGKYSDYMAIDWATEEGKTIYNKINLYPFIVPNDYCYTFLNGKKIVLKKASFIYGRKIATKVGRFCLQGLTILIQAKNGIIACKLFSDLRFRDSLLLFFLKNRGILGKE